MAVKPQYANNYHRAQNNLHAVCWIKSVTSEIIDNKIKQNQINWEHSLIRITSGNSANALRFNIKCTNKTPVFNLTSLVHLELLLRENVLLLTLSQ